MKKNINVGAIILFALVGYLVLITVACWFWPSAAAVLSIAVVVLGIIRGVYVTWRDRNNHGPEY